MFAELGNPDTVNFNVFWDVIVDAVAYNLLRESTLGVKPPPELIFLMFSAIVEKSAVALVLIPMSVIALAIADFPLLTELFKSSIVVVPPFVMKVTPLALISK